MGANDMYDVVKFRVAASKTQPLAIATEIAPRGSTVWLLPYRETKVVRSGAVRKAETFQKEYAYYTVAMQTPETAVSCPLMNEAGEVIGLMQQPASAADSLSYAVSARFADSLKVTGFSLNDPTLKMTAIKKENKLLPSGTIYTDKYKSDVRAVAQFEKASDIEKIFVQNSSKAQIPLTAVASVRHQNARVNRYGEFNGESSVMMLIYKNSDANVVETADNIERKLENIRRENPDYQFTVTSNDADYVRNSLNNTLGTLIEGLITSGLVLFLFLRGWRSMAAVMVAIPTSLIATFFVMYSAGFTFNMMSLMGMATCIGILVDDSIVVLENIHRFLQNGYNARDAAEQGRMQIGMAAIAMTLCDVVVFLPIAFMQSATGQLFRQFGLTIVFATLMSLVVSFTLTPMMASKLYAGGLEEPQGKVWDFFDNLERNTIRRYEVLLRNCLQHPKKLLTGIIALFLCSLLLIPLGIVGAEYMPKTDESALQVNVELPIGSNAQQTNEVLLLFDDYLRTIPEIKHHMSYVTTLERNGKISITLCSKNERSRSVWTIAEDIRAFARNHLGSARTRVNVIQSSVAGVSGGRNLVNPPKWKKF